MRRSLATMSSVLKTSQVKNLLTIELNRPKALNALDMQMVKELNKILIQMNKKETNGDIGAFLVKGNEGGKAFCAGGDIKTIWEEVSNLMAIEKGWEVGTGRQDMGHLHADFFRDEYKMNYRLGNSIVPQISLWDGFVMGGGVGLSIFGEFRVASEKTVFAMPETAIGIFPDVGASAWISHIRCHRENLSRHFKADAEAIPEDHGIGMYIGLTGARLNAADVLVSGIATHLVPSASLPQLEEEIARLDLNFDKPVESRKEIRKILQSYSLSNEQLANDHEKATSGGTMDSVFAPSNLITHADAIARCFGSQASSVEEIIARLEHEADEASSGQPHNVKWAKGALKMLTKMSPTSLKITFQQVVRGKSMLNLQDCLKMEYRMILRCMQKPDFREGVRGVLVDRNHTPQWSPAKLEDISQASIEEIFSPLEWEENEWNASDVY